MPTTLITYLLYLVISIALTVWVAKTLHKNGRIFLLDVFAGNEALTDSVNHLLVVGFYLINLGYIALHLELGHAVVDAVQGMEALAGKIGTVLLVLGGMHFMNLAVFARMRRRGREKATGAPVEPDEWLHEG